MSAYQDRACVIYQNWLHPAICSILYGASHSSPDLPGNEWTNTMLLTPGRPGRAIPALSDAAEATIVYTWGQGRKYTIEGVAIIEAHSLIFDDPGTEITVERRMDFRIRYQVVSGGVITTALDWTALSFTDITYLGDNFAVVFNSPFSCWRLYVDFKPQSTTGTTWGPSIGAVLAGRVFTMPSRVLAPLGRSLRGGAIVSARPYGPVVAKQQERSTRAWGMRFRDATDIDRLSFERLIANRGRATNFHPALRARVDGLTAMIPPDLWYSTTSEIASCAFGKFSGLAASTVLGGGAYTDTIFEESA